MISFIALRRNVDTILLNNSGSGALVRALACWPPSLHGKTASIRRNPCWIPRRACRLCLWTPHHAVAQGNRWPYRSNLLRGSLSSVGRPSGDSSGCGTRCGFRPDTAQPPQALRGIRGPSSAAGADLGLDLRVHAWHMRFGLCCVHPRDSGCCSRNPAYSREQRRARGASCRIRSSGRPDVAGCGLDAARDG